MPHVDALCVLLERLIREHAAEPDHVTDVVGELVPQLRVMLAHAGYHDDHHDDHHSRDGGGLDGEVAVGEAATPVDPATALALVAAARAGQEHLVAIERAAAALARDSGVTLRRLADAANITERAAVDRYRQRIG